MAREEKVAVVERVTEQFNEAAATLLTDYRGLTVDELADLRAELRKVDASYHVVKNTLTRIAAKNAGLDGLDDMLRGPTALVFCGEDPVGPAKALRAFGKDHEALIVKGGYMEGAPLDATSAEALADLESREDLLAKLAGLMNNALAGFARLLQAPLTDMGRLMAALEDDGGVEAKGFSPSGAPEAEADAAPTDEAADGDDAETAADDADEPAAADDAAVDAADVDSSDSSDSSDDSEDSPESVESEDSPESVDSPDSDDSDDEDDSESDDDADDDSDSDDDDGDDADDDEDGDDEEE